MSKKTLVAFIVIIIVIIIAVLFFLLPNFLKNKNGESISVTQAVKDIFPFGRPAETSTPNVSNGNNTNTNPNGNNSGENILDPNRPVPKLRHITNTPTAGAITIERDREVLDENKKKTILKEYFVRYMDRGNGHISETQTTSFTVDKISNTTIPQVYEALFSPDGNSIIARMLGDNLDDIKTYSIILKNKIATTTKITAGKNGTTTASSTLVVAPISPDDLKIKDVVGSYLDLNLRELAVNQAGTKFAALLYDGDGGKIAVYSTDGKNRKTIYTSPLREWLLQFATENKIIISTKPSGFFGGFAYILDIANGSVSKLFGNINGLTTLASRDLTYILLGRGGNDISFSAYKIKNIENIGLSFKTLPEKCVWGKKEQSVVYCAVPQSIPSATYPESWYQGSVSFNDQIWKMDLKTGTTKLLASPEQNAGQSIDAINLDISPDDTYLTFINKKDLTLWGLTLIEATSTKTTASTTTSTTSATNTATSTKTK